MVLIQNRTETEPNNENPEPHSTGYKSTKLLLIQTYWMSNTTSHFLKPHSQPSPAAENIVRQVLLETEQKRAILTALAERLDEERFEARAWDVGVEIVRRWLIRVQRHTTWQSIRTTAISDINLVQQKRISVLLLSQKSHYKHLPVNCLVISSNEHSPSKIYKPQPCSARLWLGRPP